MKSGKLENRNVELKMKTENGFVLENDRSLIHVNEPLY